MPIDPINELQQAIGRGGFRLFDAAPDLLREILKDRLWEQRKNREGKEFESFEAFATHSLWQGLETNIADLLLFCRDKPEVRAMILNEVGKLQHHGTNQYGGLRNTNSSTDNATYALKRLKRDRPDLAAKVIAGDLSANAAAIQAGFRKKPTDFELALRYFRKLSDADRAAFKAEICP